MVYYISASAARPPCTIILPIPLGIWALQRSLQHSFICMHPLSPPPPSPQNLLHSPQAPQLPACYPALMVVAVFPPLWFRLMHPLLDAAEAGEREGESEGEREGAEAPGAA